jgi:crotonobetainyl-CoA:carnitine CoA-transferase CaiB-like acyl-CoA transferase
MDVNSWWDPFVHRTSGAPIERTRRMTSKPTDRAGHAGPLAGVRVVELATTLMGPYAAMMLAQLGADVIKVEAPGGDINRNVADASGVGMASGFINSNLGKRSIELDLTDDADRRSFLDLIRWADVFVHNRPPSAAARLRVDYPSLKEVNPRLVHCSAIGFGAQGPYRDLPAYDDVIQAASGLAYVQGPTQPAYIKSAIADKICGLTVVGAINAALYERERSGQGQSIEVPMFETMAAVVLIEQQQGWLFDPPRGDTLYSRTASPYRRPYVTADGTISVVVYTDRHWASFFALIGRPQLTGDARFSTVRARTENIDELYQIVEDSLREKTTAEWIDLLRAQNIPAMPVNSLTDLFSDPHLRSTGFFQAAHQPGVGAVRPPSYPAAFSRTALGPPRPAPRLDEHRTEIKEQIR